MTTVDAAPRPAPPPRAAGPAHRDTPRGWHDHFVRFAGQVVTLAAFWSLISIPIRHWPWPDRVDDVFGLLNVPAGPSVFVAVLMFMLANALRRRLRAAMLLALVYQALVTVVQALVVAVALPHWQQLPTADVDTTRRDVVLLGIGAVLGGVIVVLLWLSRRAFAARLSRGARLRSLIVLAAGLATSVVVTFLLAEAFPGRLHGTGERVRWTLNASLDVGLNTDTLHGHHGPHWVTVLAGLMSAVALLAAAWVFLRSARAKQFLGARDELAVRRLLLEGGEQDSLGYFATRRDKSVILAPDGRAAVTYRVVASVSLASADPIGRSTSWPDAIAAWLAEARQYGWFPAVLSASEPGAKAYVAAGLKALAIGDEAVIDVDGFSLDGRTMRPVRQAVTRVRRAGYTIRARRHGDIPPDELAGLEGCAQRWRGDDTERGFSMALNRLGDPADERCVMVTAHDCTGAVRGLLSFVPWGRRGLSLDLMRRDHGAENGLVEFMVTGLVDAAPELGVTRISLNFAMFRSVFSAAEQVGAGPVLRLTEAVLSLASKLWQLETLYRSNAKYLPRWVPRYLCYDSSLTLTRAAIASGMAEGFLPSVHPTPPRSAAERITLADGAEVEFADAVRQQEEQLLRLPRPAQATGEQQRVRRDKIARLAAAGQPAYPVAVPRTCPVGGVRARHQGLPADHRTGERVSVTGRVRALRDFGGVCFAVLQDEGQALQAMLTASDTPAEARDLWRRAVDLGDQVSVTGEIVTSRRGELSVLVDDWAMAAKCLRPLPDAHAGLSDPDARVRQRYLDLLANPDAMRVLRARSVAVRALRDAFAARGFTEVETPMLQAVHGGATARPFRTHINAYDMDLYLRIAPELYLKRLCVAGMGKIFELNRNFRNEGADATHNPEFTSVEAYQAHADYVAMRELTRELVIDVAMAVHGAPVAIRPDAPDGAHRVDLSLPWPVTPVHEAVSKACDTEVTPRTPARELREICGRYGVHSSTRAGPGELVLDLYEALVEKQTLYPTFYTDFPLETSPLTRTHRLDPALAERWDLVAFGAEIGTAYSELVDPIDQRERLTEQSMRAAAGDPEAMELDEAFLTALEYAMPPTGGLGIGVDRLVMMLTGTNIRATLAFPFVRPQR